MFLLLYHDSKFDKWNVTINTIMGIQQKLFLAFFTQNKSLVTSLSLANHLTCAAVAIFLNTINVFHTCVSDTRFSNKLDYCYILTVSAACLF